MYRASLGLPGRFRNVGALACISHTLRSMHVPTGKIPKNSMNTALAQGADFQPLTVENYHVLIEAGDLEGQTIELINGVLTRKLATSVEHRGITDFIFRGFYNALASEKRAVVMHSFPISLHNANSESEADVLIASGVPSDYDSRHPGADDILLLIEVSKAALYKDSHEKLELYASVGIPEYWIVDVKHRSVRVLRNPEGKRYLHDETFYGGDIAPATFPDVNIGVKELV